MSMKRSKNTKGSLDDNIKRLFDQLSSEKVVERPGPEWFSTREAAEAAGMSKSAAREKLMKGVKLGKLESNRINGIIWYREI